MVNDMAFEGAEEMAGAAIEAGRTVARLRSEAGWLSVPAVYVNDNYGLWHSERSKIVDCRRRGRTLGERRHLRALTAADAHMRDY